jgi:DNA-binding NtrC family response regulator
MALEAEWVHPERVVEVQRERERSMAQEIVIGSEAAVVSLKERVAAYERKLIQEALWFAGGNQRRAAAALGCLPTTLNEKMRRLGLRGQYSVAPHERPPAEPTIVTFSNGV